MNLILDNETIAAQEAIVLYCDANEQAELICEASELFIGYAAVVLAKLAQERQIDLAPIREALEGGGE